ncbi:MAG TPA: hypothetical protein PLV42_12580 [bacterium]|nr:hypothetical protein [bacterium]
MIRIPVVMVSAVFLSLIACGGPASYTTPLILQSQIVQSACEEISTAEVPGPVVTVRVQNGTVVVTHENLYLPKGTVLGIEDRDGLMSWRDAEAYYYLDGGTDFISLRESARMVNSDIFCLYDLTVTIRNISGGEYTFYLFDHTGAAVPEATVDLDIR